MTGRRYDPGSFDNAEQILKQELAELHVLYHRQAAPILCQLARIETMKPPSPIWLDMVMVDPQLMKMLRPVPPRPPLDPAPESLSAQLSRLEHERKQVEHLLRMIRSAVPDSLPPSILDMIDRELGDKAR